jgi:hypothetical protein
MEAPEKLKPLFQGIAYYSDVLENRRATPRRPWPSIPDSYRPGKGKKIGVLITCSMPWSLNNYLPSQ